MDKNVPHEPLPFVALRERTIWEGRCPKCGENGFVPDPDNRRIFSVSRWCSACEVAVPCEKTSYTGPELEPMPPAEHHVWCNGQRGPVKGCRWCLWQDKETGLWDGFWVRYPYNPLRPVPEGFAEKHFPGVKVRR
jgi:hypothetical protein